jgi:hypothetical protein
MTRQERLREQFFERAEREKEERGRAAKGGTQHHEDNEVDTPPAPPRRWERWAGTGGFRETTVSLTGSNPHVDRVLAEKYGSRQYSRERIREAEDGLHRRLSGSLNESERIPLTQRPEPAERPMCPVDAVLLETVSYTAGMRPAVRRCPVCKRTEKHFLEKGVDLTPITEGIRRSMTDGGLVKKSTRSPVEEHVRSLTRRW